MRCLSLLLLSLLGTGALADITYTTGNVTVTAGITNNMRLNRQRLVKLSMTTSWDLGW
jgi:hypothetical protein